MISINHSFKRLAGDRPSLPNLDGDVFILGSAPNPIIPRHLLTQSTVISVNGSQVMLNESGIKCPDFTFMRSNMWFEREVDRETLDVLRGRSTKNLVIVAATSKNSQIHFKRQIKCLSEIRYNFENLHLLSKSHRYQIVNGNGTGIRSVLVSRLSASLGLCAVMGGLYMGARRAIFSGISFRNSGYAYNSSNHERRHLEGDVEVVRSALQQGQAILTCDQSFAEDTGVGLYSE